MKFISKRAAAVSPYVAGEQPQDKAYIKLNTNENPYSPSPLVQGALDFADIAELRKYPDPNCRELKAEIAKTRGVGVENVFVGNGSDEVLALAFPAFFDEGSRVAYADITYSFYSVFAQFNAVKSDIIPLRSFQIDVDDYLSYTGNGIIIVNPNAPTGTALPLSDIERVLAANSDKIVIIDEAYIDFCGCSAAPLVPKYDNLLVVQTFSKSYALAGIRLGYALGQPQLIEVLERVKNSFNSYTVSRLTQKIGIVALQDKKYFEKRLQEVCEVRDEARSRLISAKFRVLPSGANFLFVEVGDGERYYLALKERGILVRFFKKPQLERFLRVTVGTRAEMEQFLQEIIAIRGD